MSNSIGVADAATVLPVRICKNLGLSQRRRATARRELPIRIARSGATMRDICWREQELSPGSCGTACVRHLLCETSVGGSRNYMPCGRHSVCQALTMKDVCWREQELHAGQRHIFTAFSSQSRPSLPTAVCLYAWSKVRTRPDIFHRPSSVLESKPAPHWGFI